MKLQIWLASDALVGGEHNGAENRFIFVFGQTMEALCFKKPQHFFFDTKLPYMKLDSI